MARSWAERTDCMASRAHPLDLEQLRVAQARKDERTGVLRSHLAPSDVAGARSAESRRASLGTDRPPTGAPLRNSVAAYRTAHKRWPKAAITLQQGMRISEDSGEARIAPQ